MRVIDKFKEEDFEFFRNGVLSGRLNTVSMGSRLFIFPLLSALGIYGSAELAYSEVIDAIWFPFIVFQIISGALLLILSVFYFSTLICLKFQKLQMVVLILSTLKMTFDLTFACLGALKQQFSALPFSLIVFLYSLFSVLLLFFSQIRAYLLLKQGQFKKNGKGLIGKRFDERLSRFSNIIIASLTAAFIGAFGTAFFGGTGIMIVAAIIMMILSVIIYSVGITEFVFVLYCKIRYPSFNITVEQEKEEEKNDELLLKQFEMMEKQEKEKRRQQRREKRSK